MHIRCYEASDLDTIITVFTQSVHQLTGEHYTDAQRNAWAPRAANREKWAARMEGLNTLVADGNDGIAGFLAYEMNGYIDLLYVSPRYARGGVASALYREVESALVSTGLKELFTEASAVARPFFEKQGFKFEAEQTVNRRGVGFNRFAMRKIII
ncbi:MAG: GNAT family N-acetyltransferase [Cellvibrionaceae bacterium]